MRETARELSPHKGVQKCGRTRVFRGAVELRGGYGTGKPAHFTGLHRCHSVWECPVCMQAISMGRAEELRAVLAEHRKRGGSDYMVTLTLPHRMGDALKPMRERVARAWQFVQSGAPWKRVKHRYGVEGYVRGLEETVGVSGWHPHLHVILLTRRKITKGEAEALKRWLYERWCTGIAKRKAGEPDYGRPSWEHGISLEPGHVAKYLAKFGLADELAKPSFKRARNGNRTPLQVLYDITRNARPGARPEAGEVAADLAIWGEYARAMRGARQLTWSKVRKPGGQLVSLNQVFGVEEAPDEQLSLEVQGAEDLTPVYSFANEDWDRVIGPSLKLRLWVLDVAERHAPARAAVLITQALVFARDGERLPF